ncbi:hypothetical protein R1sor_013881 [Riccia sorocarpa]|uniref:Uncharacterized protein n=1 Tax=Riccia sorocarpa TaxID=122646 RepID=A0ABD3H7V5_9MARC
MDSKRKLLSQLTNKNNPTELDLHKFGVLTNDVRRLEAIKDHKLRLWARDKFIAKGESCSAYYLRRFKARGLRGKIHSLKREDGSVARSQPELVQEVHRFFSKTFARPQDSDNALRDRKQLLQVMDPVISAEQRTLLTKAPSYREFSDILAASPKGKAPGLVKLIPKELRPESLLGFRGMYDYQKYDYWQNYDYKQC